MAPACRLRQLLPPQCVVFAAQEPKRAAVCDSLVVTHIMILEVCLEALVVLCPVRRGAGQRMRPRRAIIICRPGGGSTRGWRLAVDAHPRPNPGAGRPLRAPKS